MRRRCCRWYVGAFFECSSRIGNWAAIEREVGGVMWFVGVARRSQGVDQDHKRFRSQLIFFIDNTSSSSTSSIILQGGTVSQIKITIGASFPTVWWLRPTTGRNRTYEANHFGSHILGYGNKSQFRHPCCLPTSCLYV